MEIQWLHDLGIALIPVSRKNFKKSLTFEYLCSPIFFHYYGNSLFPYFENCMDSMEKSLQIIEWEIYRYSYLFSMNWEKIFPNLFKNQQPGNYMAFHRIFPCYGNLNISRNWGFYKYDHVLTGYYMVCSDIPKVAPK